MQKQQYVKSLFSQKQQNEDQSFPVTPKKKSQFRQLEVSSTPRVKFRYTMVEKPTNTWTGKVFFFVWLISMIIVFGSSYQTKILNLQQSLKVQIQQCQIDFEKNKCETPAKFIRQFCAQKDKCMRSQLQDLLSLRTNNALFLGQLLREFLEGLGFVVVAIGLLYFLISGFKAKQTKKEFVEYYP